ncbi:hypothetical protein ELI30_34170 (plasmid) [Rhizobium leguminosarum]|nr:hypothetical protein ELI31_33050 [Rhizobium leguminosarum]TAV42567.1 hypothetical protein ELI32_34360 [Rhizobium leguminosarum]TAV61817.1 hypothetical protein ELI30_34170 [Rhizobium leguminosarum]TAY65244.1 hypothetical protein ELH82_02800 [Rhizobium leguminosarum]
MRAARAWQDQKPGQDAIAAIQVEGLDGGGHGKSVSRYSVAHIANEPSAIQHHAPIKIVILSDEHRGMAREWA